VATIDRRCTLCKEKKRATEKVELKERLRNGDPVLVCPICDFADNGRSKTTVKDIQKG